MTITWMRGNALDLLENGCEFFPALQAAIDAAEAEIFLETYIFANDETGHGIAAALRRAAGEIESFSPAAAACLAGAQEDCLVYMDFPSSHWRKIRTNNVQERTNREIKRRSRVVQVFPSTGSLVRLAGAVMCEQVEIWQESRYFSEVRMNELYDDGRTRGIDGPVEWARLEAEARKMLESGLELADRVEAA